MKKFTVEIQEMLLKAAKDVNFWGKRKRDTKLECIEDLKFFAKFEAAKLVDWLEENKPEKPMAKRAASNKLDPKTMQGNESRQRDNLAVISGTKFIVCSAQNNTVPSSILAQLESLATALRAQLIILPTYYNKKAFSASCEDESEYFDPAIMPYLVDQDHWLHDENCVKIAAQAAIPLTAKQPINGCQQLNNGELCTIVAHPKMQQRTLPRMAGEEIKTAWTTGSCTTFNYLRGRAGSEAENFHCFGALIVEIEKEKPFVTNVVQGLDGSLMVALHDHTLIKINAPNATQPVLSLGDCHFEMHDSLAFEKCKNMIKAVKPKMLVLHDIAHSNSRNHHQIGQSSHWYKSKSIAIFDELKFIIARVNEYADSMPYGKIFLVESNHNSVIDGWLNSQFTASNITFDTINTKLYHLMKYLVCEAIDHSQDYRGLVLAFSNMNLTGLPSLASNVVWGSAHVPEIANNFSFENHGHKGANGASKGLTGGKIAQSMVLGHTHSPEISYLTSRGGIITAGVTAKMDQGYNRGGASSWGQSNVLVHSNGTAQQIFIAL